MSESIRVLIIDDSPLIREALRSVLTAASSIEVVGMAQDGREGVQKALALKPDVITMDLQMPQMSGLEAIEEIMQKTPIPIVVVSSMNVRLIVKALSVGAMDFVPVTQDIEKIAHDLVEKIRVAARVKPVRRIRVRPVAPDRSPKKETVAKIVAVGISTGGPQALQVLFSKLPVGLAAGILVVQHMASGFIGGLVEWLRTSSAFDVRVAQAGDILKSGTILVAPDDYNMLIDENAAVFLKEDVTRRMLHVPSIDVTMKSVAASYGKDAIGVIMTGMGRDGFEGMKAIRAAGGMTIAQDEKTSAIFGMNRMAIEAGCVDKVLGLEEIAGEIARLVPGGR